MRKDNGTLDIELNAASSGDNTLIPAVEDGRIVIWKIWAVASGAVNYKFKHGSTYFETNAIPFTAAGSNICFAFDGEPYYRLAKNEAFAINLSGAVQVTGRIYYTVER